MLVHRLALEKIAKQHLLRTTRIQLKSAVVADFGAPRAKQRPPFPSHARPVLCDMLILKNIVILGARGASLSRFNNCVTRAYVSLRIEAACWGYVVPTAWELIDRLFKNYLLRIVILEHGQVLNKVVLVLFKNYGMSFRLKDNSNQEHVEAIRAVQLCFRAPKAARRLVR